MQNYRFPKACRLRKSKQIESLFKLGSRFYEYPYNVVWLENNSSNYNIKIAISIPKKLVVKASQRNRIKRLTREAVRKKSYILKCVKFNFYDSALLLNVDGIKVFVFRWKGKNLIEYLSAIMIATGGDDW